MSERVPMSGAGYEKLEQELRRLKKVDRLEIVREIEAARAHGDLSENAEFHAAKEQQSHIETRIMQVEDRLARAQVIDPSGQTLDSVRFGVTVDLEDSDTGDSVSYTIVGEDETDVSNGRISVTSPIAKALLGKGVGASVTVRVPKGTREFEVLEIRFE